MVTMVLSAPPSDIDTPPCPLCGTTCFCQQELHQLRQEVVQLKEQVRTDALTGLYNYRFFSEILPLEIERASRSYQPLSLILLDIDHFKKFNDRWGHEVGNRALYHVAQLIGLTIRKLDFACRFGGEEFVILLPNTDLRHAINVAERLREIIANTPLMYEQEPVQLTASLGVDEYRGVQLGSKSSANAESNIATYFIGRVDALLYQAKNSGRNCVASPDVDEVDINTTVTPEEKNALLGAFRNDE